MRSNGRLKSIGQALIDLTPLLDVVFILLIVVLSAQTKYVADANTSVENAREEVAETKEENDNLVSENEGLEENNKTYADLHNYVNVVTVFANYKPSNIRYRTIYLIVNDKTPKEIDLNPSNGNQAWQECEETIEWYLENDPGKPMVYTIKNEKMLYRDESELEKMFERLSSKYTKTNIYLRNDIKTENDSIDN